MRTHHHFIRGMFIIFIFLLFSYHGVYGQATLKKTGKFNTGMSYGLALKDHHAYVTTNSSLIILDIKNPEKPKKAGELKIGSPVFGLTLKGHKAYLAASDKGLVIANISDPKKPEIIGNYSSKDTMANVKVDNNYGYTIEYEDGFKIFDITIPEEPKLIGGMRMNTRALFIQDQLAFISDPIKGLFVLDISDPEDLKILTIVDNTEGAAGIKLYKELLYLGSYDNWINVYDISEPRSPQLVTRYTYPYEVSNFVVTNNYLVTNFEGLIIKDISDVMNPVSFAEYHARGLKGMAHGIVLEGNYLYYVKKGLTVLRLEEE